MLNPKWPKDKALEAFTELAMQELLKEGAPKNRIELARMKRKARELAKKLMEDSKG